jgi:serine/threonine-protein kinase
MIGTPAYMAPEQIQGQSIDRRTDVFSAGVLFYQLLTGQKPFEGTQWALAKKIVQDDPLWPSSLVQSAPEIDRVVARALAKAPEHRYQSARRFADALRRIAAGKPPEDPDETVTISTAALAAAAKGSEAETEFWNGVKDSDDPEDVKLYIEQFPAGVFVEQAQRKVAELRAKKS